MKLLRCETGNCQAIAVGYWTSAKGKRMDLCADCMNLVDRATLEGAATYFEMDRDRRALLEWARRKKVPVVALVGEKYE